MLMIIDYGMNFFRNRQVKFLVCFLEEPAVPQHSVWLSLSISFPCHLPVPSPDLFPCPPRCLPSHPPLSLYHEVISPCKLLWLRTSRLLVFFSGLSSRVTLSVTCCTSCLLLSSTLFCDITPSGVINVASLPQALLFLTLFHDVISLPVVRTPLWRCYQHRRGTNHSLPPMSLAPDMTPL